jgi:hypothetical protein
MDLSTVCFDGLAAGLLLGCRSTRNGCGSLSFRTVLRQGAIARNILSFVVHQERNHLAVIPGGSEYDKMLAMVLEQHSPDFGVKVITFPLYPSAPMQDPIEHEREMFQKLKDSGIRTIFRTFSDRGPRAVKRLSEDADKYHLLGDDYLYIFDENIAPVEDIAQIVGSYEKDSPMDKLLSGSIVISAAEPWEIDVNNRFLRSWRNLSGTFVDLVNRNVPLAAAQPEYIQGSPDFFKPIIRAGEQPLPTIQSRPLALEPAMPRRTILARIHRMDKTSHILFKMKPWHL